ncbi:MAG: efflux RND transporter periplasmic adaptor subunit [Polyangiaceae bacterium]|nr:efflux RND transporter periplasmic adaptor subunit [Polyangiaceae bacterium]
MSRSTYLVFAATIAASCSSAPTSTPSAPAVRVEEVRAREVALGTTHLAIVRARDAADVRPQVVGVVTAIEVRSGAFVEAGDVLMRIDRRRQAASVEGARAASSFAQSNLERARADLASLEAEHEAAAAAVAFADHERVRFEDLFAADGAPLQARQRTATELERANAALRAVEARMAAQRAAIDGLSSALREASSSVRAGVAELSYYTVVAPVTGRLGDIPVRVGDLVSPSDVLTTVEGSSVLELYVQVPSHEIGRLRAGLDVEVLGPTGERLDQTQLSFVAPQVDPRTQTILAKAPVEGEGLVSGRFVDAHIVWERKESMTVPPAGVLRVNDQPFVYVVGEDSAVAQRPVRLGPLIDQRFVVESGLEVGERVVSAGILRLRDGVGVAIETEPSEPSASSSVRN